ncbi:MAG: hypothetical protein LH650_00935 [Chloroflexi bacterium]|nr:hypothetical protein [Chloroflexota bacterium]
MAFEEVAQYYRPDTSLAGSDLADTGSPPVLIQIGSFAPLPAASTYDGYAEAFLDEPRCTAMMAQRHDGGHERARSFASALVDGRPRYAG